MIKNTIILVLFAITLSSCMGEKYEWSVNISAPKEYPVVVQRGFMGKSFFGPSSVNASWGIGLEAAPKQAFLAPDDFEITWLSLVERKFYKGKWILPKNKIQQYLEEGFNYNNKKIKCNKIQIGLAPKGMVVVWLLGDYGMQIEVGRYQATQIVLESKDVYDSSKFMFEKDFIDKKLADPNFVTPEIQENIKKYGYPLPTTYDLYRKKYNWEPKLILPEGSKMSSITLKRCNGENETVKHISSLNVNQSLPYYFKIIWKDKNQQEFISRIAFIKNKEYWEKYLKEDKEELPLNFEKNAILEQFQEKLDKKIATQIVIKIDKESISDLYFEQGSKIYPFTEFSQQTQKVVKITPVSNKVN
ncbi:DUF2931 family protein [Flavobacterium aquidurense]|uniref:DUF2931 domain containing protein n=1 Tax=Flavobacterium aquidurense TaxID=362413 RepID=A0A0Q0S9G7_9FLAO|nr:DUF2931 family protein [Flavobacterium aquidurense]KQB40382.1 DUF2931 domain containing protein [Flavobacterium aquidurense]